MPRARCLPVEHGQRVQAARTRRLVLDAHFHLFAAAGLEGVVVRVHAAIGYERFRIADVRRQAVVRQVGQAGPAAEGVVRLLLAGAMQAVVRGGGDPVLPPPSVTIQWSSSLIWSCRYRPAWRIVWR
ncbi:hypothetical protein G6F31_017920 [Rhizopus arrhizus]|nr:hypothetical protein G6F31_017920 [Rhizopus arrhizus]